MSLKHSLHTWLIFGMCLAVVLAGSAWMTVVAVRADRQDAANQRAAELEENVRLALWRLDSALTPLIAQEMSRSYTQFTTYYPVAGVFNRTYLSIDDGQVFAPSPLVAFRSPYVRLHFQVDPDGTVTSPQVPTGALLEAMRTRFGEAVQVEETAPSLDQLRSLFQTHDIAAQAPPLDSEPAVAVDSASPLVMCSPLVNRGDDNAFASFFDQPVAEQQSAALAKETGRARYAPEQQQLRSTYERAQRSKIAEQSNILANEANPPIPLRSRGVPQPGDAAAKATIPSPQWRDVRLGGFRLSWRGDELLLMRRVAADGAEYIQGCWFDWPAIRDWCLVQIRDLLPEAELQPAHDWTGNQLSRTDSRPAPGQRSGSDGAASRPADAAAASRLLAAAPMRLIPGGLPTAENALASPVRHSLLAAWACVALAGAAVTVLLRGTLALSERRADFVSAVTHELRTPLTTFRMYTQMLAEGMVGNESKRASYLETLRRESDRLGHLVENVLSYARLERGRSNGPADEITLGGLLDRVGGRLRERAEQAGMTLAVTAPDEIRSVPLHTDVTAVGQILFNLVDNACKYAAAYEPPRISLHADRTHRAVSIRVQDHGPGISRDVAHRLFRPFSKSAEAAAHSAPGVGLGLALSRRLARNLGGDLRLEPNLTRGCSFVLSLPQVVS